MSLEALILAAGCTVVLNTADFAGGALPTGKGWPTFPGETVICFEPGVYNWGGWSVPGGTVETPVKVVGLIPDVPWKVPVAERVTFTGYTVLSASHNRIEKVAFDGFGRETQLFFMGQALTNLTEPHTVNHVADQILIEGGTRYYAMTMTWNSTIQNSVIRDADPGTFGSGYSQGGIAIFRDNNSVLDVEVYDRGSDCIQVAWESGQQSNILIDGMDCYQTGKRHLNSGGGVASCSEDGIDVKTGTPHAQFDGTNGNVIRDVRIWGLRRAASCEGGGGSGNGVLFHFGNTEHWTVENVDVIDSDVCFTSGTKPNIPAGTDGTPGYITYRNVRCIDPYKDAVNLGWAFVVPPTSEVIGATAIRAKQRWISNGGALNSSIRCSNVINSAPLAGVLPEDMRRTLYYGTEAGAYLETKKGERVVWANAPLQDITITRKLLTGPETLIVRDAAPSIDWRNILWGPTCDPGTSLLVGASALP